MGPDLRMLIQLPLTGRFGTPEEQEGCARLARAIEGSLAGRGLGRFGGTLVARGVNVVTAVGITPSGWEQTLALVVATLAEQGLAGRAVIVRRESAPGDSEPLCVPVWPEGHTGAFFVI